MSHLSDGRFVFIDAAKRLRAEHTDDSVKFRLLYAGDVLGFSVNTQETLVALLCPSDSAMGHGPSHGSDPGKCCMRIFSFCSASPLGDLIAELDIPFSDRVVWVGNRFLAAGSERPSTTIVELTKKQKLRVFVHDPDGALPFSVGGLLGLVKGLDTPVIELWNLEKNARVQTVPLGKKQSTEREGRQPSRRRGKEAVTDAAPAVAVARVRSVDSAGLFVIIGRTDGSFNVLHNGQKGKARLLGGSFHMKLRSRRRKKGVPEAEAQVVGGFVCAAISATELVVAAVGSTTVTSLVYNAKDRRLRQGGTVVVDSGRGQLVAVSGTRYLVQRRVTEGESRTGKVTHVCGDLALEATPLPKEATAPSPGNGKRGREMASSGNNNGSGEVGGRKEGPLVNGRGSTIPAPSPAAKRASPFTTDNRGTGGTAAVVAAIVVVLIVGVVAGVSAVRLRKFR